MIRVSNEIKRICKVRYKWSAGMGQYLLSMPHMLFWFRNACSYPVCMHSVTEIQLLILTGKETSLRWLPENYLDLASIDEVGTTQQELMKCSNAILYSLIWLVTGYIFGICLLQAFHHEEAKSKSDGLTFNIWKCSPTITRGSSSSHVVEVGNFTRSSAGVNR